MGKWREDIKDIVRSADSTMSVNGATDELIALVCKRIEGVENPYPITRYYDPRYLDKPVHDAFEKARKSFLDVIKEE